MGFTGRFEEDKIIRLQLIQNFIKLIIKLTPSQRVKYIQSMSNKEIDYISEICLNFLKSNITTDKETVKVLDSLRNEIRSLGSKGKSRIWKKKLLLTLKGLRVLQFLFPIVLNGLQFL